MSLILKSPQDVSDLLAHRFRERRLRLDLSQAGLAQRAGVNLHTLRKFERTGKVSLDILLKLAIVLGVLDDFENIAATGPAIVSGKSLDDVIAKPKSRRRGRKT